MRFIFISLIALVLCSFIPPIIIPHTNSSEQHEITDDEYNNTFILKLRDATGWVLMEGTLIAENWIITAAHGLSSVEPNQNIIVSGQDVTISEIHIHPDWDGENNDIALLKIDRNLALKKPVYLYEGQNEVGKEITLVGHGWFGTGLTGPAEDDGKFRMATNKIDNVSDYYLTFRFDEPGHPNSTSLEGISGPADSGGPAFIKTERGLELIGISSHQDNAVLGLKEGTYGVIEYYTRISQYTNWINNVMSGNVETNSGTIHVEEGQWAFGDGELSKRASAVMNALAYKRIDSDMIEGNFTQSFQESTDLMLFLEAVSNFLENPAVTEVKKVKPHLISFVVSNSNDKVYYFQFDGEKRDNYLISGLTVKKIN